MQGEKVKLYFHGEYLDEAHREHVNVLLMRDSRVSEVDNPDDADFCVIDARKLTQHPQLEWGNKYIVLSFGDLYHAMGGLRKSDATYRYYLKMAGKRLVYFLCETSPCRPYSIVNGESTEEDKLYTDDNMILLTMPLGYLDGPKINIYYEGNDTRGFFVKNFKVNKKQYSYDWCWIGAKSSGDRKQLLRMLWDRRDEAWTNLDQLGRARFPVTGTPNGAKGILIESQICMEKDWDKRKKLLHADNKTIPHDDYVDYCRKSKVNICGNGWGMWCPRDGEFFSRNCFNLRQWHKNISNNPLTPKDGKHWVLFKNNEFEQKLDYYVANDVERERINDAGHEYFKQGVTGAWAKVYADAFIEYLNTGSKRAFGGLAYGAHL